MAAHVFGSWNSRRRHSIILYFYLNFDGTLEFALIKDEMSIIMTVTSRRDVRFTMCSYKRPSIKLGSALTMKEYYIFPLRNGFYSFRAQTD